MTMTSHAQILDALRTDGVVELPNLLTDDALAGLQRAFRRVLERPNFNTWNGYQQNEKWRILVENALTVDPAVVRLALDPLLKSVLHDYLGRDYALTEARGWRTIQTRTNFHGWHNDAWYKEPADATAPRPREVKLALYLTDVTSGHFAYIAGSHSAPGTPRHWSAREVAPMQGRQRNLMGRAGTAFLFDTAGIHCQTTPVLTARDVLFLNFHDPAVAIQKLDVDNGRYQPLLLNAAFLPELDADDRRILGFGRLKGSSVADNVVGLPSVRRFPWLHNAVEMGLAARLELLELHRQVRRVTNRLRRLPPRRPAPQAPAATGVSA
jgi:hypothetical protein